MLVTDVSTKYKIWQFYIQPLVDVHQGARRQCSVSRCCFVQQDWLPIHFTLYKHVFHYRSTKCELAKVMNRQTCYQELLQQKEDTIKHMAEHSGDSHNQITAEDNRKSRYMQMMMEVSPK